VVHIQNFSQFVPLVRRKMPQARIVLHMHANWLVELDKLSLESRLSQVDAIVGNSEYVTSAIRKHFPHHADRCHTVFNGVDADLFHPPAAHVGYSSQDLIVYLGRLSPEKGIHVLLDAFEKVLTVRPSARLELIGATYVAPIDFIVSVNRDPVVRKLSRFYGKESYEEFLQRRMRKGLATRVTCAGDLAHEDVADHLRLATLLVAPSLSETFGLPVAEAMATALPVVASRTGALPELIEDQKTGLLVNCDDPTALAQAILRLLEDRRSAQELGLAARQRVLRFFTWDKSAEKLRVLYSTLCGGGAAPSASGVCDDEGEERPPLGHYPVKGTVTAPMPAKTACRSPVGVSMVRRR
jgi:glycosyltransferase involved in cell wall biosynthesis